MNKRTKLFTASLMVLMGLAMSIRYGAGAPSSFSVPWHTFDGGGGRSSGGNLEVIGTSGQPDVGAIRGGAFSHSGGFWQRTFSLDLTADLTLNKSVTPQQLMPGDLVTYTLTYRNDGTALATGVVLTDYLPAAIGDATYQSSDAGLIEMGRTPLQWQVADMAPGSGGTITVTGTVDATMSGGSDLVNRATITAASDSNLANNEAEATLSVIDAGHWLFFPVIVGIR